MVRRGQFQAAPFDETAAEDALGKDTMDHGTKTGYTTLVFTPASTMSSSTAAAALPQPQPPSHLPPIATEAQIIGMFAYAKTRVIRAKSLTHPDAEFKLWVEVRLILPKEPDSDETMTRARRS